MSWENTTKRLPEICQDLCSLIVPNKPFLKLKIKASSKYSSQLVKFTNLCGHSDATDFLRHHKIVADSCPCSSWNWYLYGRCTASSSEGTHTSVTFTHTLTALECRDPGIPELWDLWLNVKMKSSKCWWWQEQRDQFQSLFYKHRGLFSSIKFTDISGGHDRFQVRVNFFTEILTGLNRYIWHKLPTHSSMQKVRIILSSYLTCPFLKVFSLVLM